MSIWQRLMYWIGLRDDPGTRYYKLTESMQVTLTTLARHERRPEHKIAQDLISAGLDHYNSSAEIWKKWESLSARQKDVTALVCLGHTNAQIAARLFVSPETVKTHLSQALRKFEVMSRYQLRDILSDWDFNAWEK
jgi:DNA-binding CsgD family transcriptional regulator